MKISASCATIGFPWYLGEQKSAEFLRFPQGKGMESGQEWPDIFLVCQLSCVPRCMYVYVYIIIMYIYI